MIKNKDDEFLGDSITRNVKYADNEWQAQGTVDRGSVYTKESLLDLLFEGFNYSKAEGDCTDYVPRASTSKISGADQKAYVAAKLQHDLYVVDLEYYSTSGLASTNNIFSVATYLKKAFALSNPIFSERAAAENVNLLGITRDGDKFKYVKPEVAELTLFDIVKFFVPEFYKNQELKASDVRDSLVKFVNRYKTEVKGSYRLVTYDSDGKLQFVDSLPKIADKVKSISLTTKIEDILDILGNIYTAKPISEDEYLEGDITNYTLYSNAADTFLHDFSVNIHNPDDIKMPFYGRGDVEVSDVKVTEEEDVRTFKTRFIVNSLSENLYNTESTLSRPLYLEYLNDILEEALFSKVAELYPGRPNIKAASQTDESLAKDLLGQGGTSGATYSHLYHPENVAYNTLLENYTKALDNIDNSISLYCPEIYSEYNVANSPEGSWGIHFVNEEATENIFQDIDNTYKLFNNVLIGYKLADTLIANRTFAGGIYYLISQFDSNVETPLSLDIPLQERSTFCSFFHATGGNSKENYFSYYPTITAINALYQLCHDGKADLREVNEDEHSYDFADKIKEWLKSECFIFKGNVYGDYVEELNFLQDLTPDSKVHFKNVRIKTTDVPYNRQQDSKYEVPYLEQTAPLLNNTTKNKEGIGTYSSDAFSGVGNIRGKERDNSGAVTQNTIPPFLYDFDKGDQSDWMDKNVDPRILSVSGNAQRVNSKDGKGNLTVENRITSPTIDELWIFLKYLTESDGSGHQSGINERLPKFYGVQKSFVENTISVEPSDTRILTNTVNPRALEDGNTKTIDILNWEPVVKEEPRLHWSPQLSDKSGNVELQFGGYKITRFIEKIYDYEVKPFSRRKQDIVDDVTYEYNTEASGDKNNVTGYLEKLYNSAILAFDLPEVTADSKLKALVNVGILYADVLDRSYKATLDDSEVQIFTKDSDEKLVTVNKPLHNTLQREKAFKDIANILNYHKADGSDATASKHNHYKKYLENPKNLKEIERDLETIRQNLQTLAEFSVASFTSLGYADRAQNRGTLHQLHKNAYDYLSTFIYSVNNTIANIVDEDYDVRVGLNPLETDLNNLKEDLTITEMDKRVTFEDGEFADRYLRENYDASVIDLNSDIEKHTRAKHYRYRPNETLLSEVYLAADGTWRSVHEHTVLPVIYSDH